MSDLKNVLARARSIDLNTEYGAAIVPEIVRRTVTFTVNRSGDVGELTLPGVAMIGDSAPGTPSNLEPFARSLGKIAVTIERTPEFLWTPVNAHRDPMVGLWTIEAVPFTEWFRLLVKSDEQILREAGMTQQ